MTDPRLHDLLHDSVRDAEMPDVADRAWRDGGRARRRRTTGVVAAVAAAPGVAAVGSTALLAGRTGEGAVSRPSPDGSFLGTPVWFAPRVGQEATLPSLPDSPLPQTIDLSAPAPDLATHPIPRAVAAYAVGSDGGVQRVVVVGPAGQLRAVDLSHVKPMADPEGNRRIDAGPAMVSPGGDYLMFPQDLGIELLRVADAHWRWLYTLPGRSTWDAQWDGPHSILVPTEEHYTYPIAVSAPANSWSTSHVSSVPHRGSQKYGPFRIGEGGVAQSYYPGAAVPQPARLRLSPAQSDWIGVISNRRTALVVPADPRREKACCAPKAWSGRSTLAYESRSSEGLRLLAWQVGTHRFWLVTKVVGWEPGKQFVNSSYADFR